jgi:formate-dependent phosphoribosylglycinamide formyltransferase (GAR transformylase)
MYLAAIMLLGSGELGREVAIAAKRLGCRVIACDRYDDAPAMNVLLADWAPPGKGRLSGKLSRRR